MDKITLKAYGKINLGLDVLGKRENGYHDINMVMQTVNLYDVLELSRTPEDHIILETDHKGLPTDEANLVYKVIRAMVENYQLSSGILVKLQKNIPIAAGMGGGSADAAAAICGMNLLFGLGLCEKEQMDIGVKIGADVPFLIMKGTAQAQGIGEELKRLKAPPKAFLLISKPKFSVSTKEVYEEFDRLKEPFHPDIHAILQALEEENLEKLCTSLGNSLEGVTAQKYPIIHQLKESMRNEGAKVALMTGSGPTIFGIFESKNEAELARKVIVRKYEMEKVVVTEWYNRG